ncbi:MAG: FHA domain-containing protein [Acidobacteriota bacterium]
MQARLFSKTGETRGTELELGAETLIGRDRKNALIIDQPLMSGSHARIFYDSEAGRFMLEDLGSLNGTELDGDRVRGTERLGHLHVITFAGSYDFFFQDLDRCAQRHPEASAQQPDAAQPVAARPVAARPVAARPVAAAKDVAAKNVAAEPAPDGSQVEITRIESQPFALPGLLADRAKQAGDVKPAGKQQTTNAEITKVDDKPAFLPEILARRSEQARKDPDEKPEPAPQAEPTPAVDSAQPPAPREPAGTVIEKMPVALPRNLAKAGAPSSAPDVRKADTVDMSDIEELISLDELKAAQARPGQLSLVMTDSEGRERRFPLEPGENTVGRSASVQISLNFRALSRRHAVLSLSADDKVTVRDLDSRNQTFVDGKVIKPKTEVAIRAGTLLRFGSVEARLTREGKA